MKTGCIDSGRALVQSPRSLLIACSNGLPGSRLPRTRLCHIRSMMELEDLATTWIARTGEFAGLHHQDHGDGDEHGQKRQPETEGTSAAV